SQLDGPVVGIDSGQVDRSSMRLSPNSETPSTESARTLGSTSLIGIRPSAPLLTCLRTWSMESFWTSLPSVTPSAVAIASASSDVTTRPFAESPAPENAAFRSARLSSVCVDQKLTTGTTGIRSDPAALLETGPSLAPTDALGAPAVSAGGIDP